MNDEHGSEPCSNEANSHGEKARLRWKSAGNGVDIAYAAQGTYRDTANDTSDSRGTIRGLLMFQDHSDTASPQFQGSGQLAYTGTLYFHSSTYDTIFQVPGGTFNNTLPWGNIVTD